MTTLTIFILILIGLLAGVLSGIVGIGGGLIIIPLLVMFLGISQHEAQGTSLAIMLPPIGILAVMNYYQQGFVKWEYALVIATTFIIGGYLGSKLALNIKPDNLKMIFGLIMMVGALKMIFGR